MTELAKSLRQLRIAVANSTISPREHLGYLNKVHSKMREEIERYETALSAVSHIETNSEFQKTLPNLSNNIQNQLKIIFKRNNFTLSEYRSYFKYAINTSMADKSLLLDEIRFTKSKIPKYKLVKDKKIIKKQVTRRI